MTTDELLEQMESQLSVYSVESPERCIIDPETREILIPLTYQILGVESDEKSERIEFQCPKIVGDNIDLSKLQIRVNYQNANFEKDQYIVEDMALEGDTIVFSWLLSRKVTAYQGTVSFIVCAVKISGDSITNEWNTTLAESEVLEGLEVDTPSPSEEQSDVIAQLLQIMKDTSDQAVEAVESAEATAKQAIEDYTEQMKATIPEDYTEMVKKVDVLERTKAPAIYQTVSGESLQIEDSADTPMAGLRVFGKSRQVVTTGAQLFDASKLPTKTQGGATVTNNGDGSFTISGSGNLSTNFIISKTYTYEETIELIKVGTLYCKGNENTVYPYFECGLLTSNGDWVKQIRNDGQTEITEDDLSSEKGNRLLIRFYGKSGVTIKTGTVKPMLYQDGDGTWEPYTGGKPAPSPDYPQEIEIPGNEGSVGVNVTGAQLFDASKLPTKTQGGATFTNNGDGSFTILGNGKLTEPFTLSYKLSHDEAIKILKPGNLYMKGGLDGQIYFELQLLSSAGNKYLRNNSSVYITDNMLSDIECSFIIYGKNGSTITNATFRPMVYYQKHSDGTWEPYKEPQNISINTPNGLPGIPVDSGGNYTDSDGQQWICDEVDFTRGKYVQRVKKVVYDGSEDEAWIVHTTTNDYGIANFRIYIADSGNNNGLCSHLIAQSTLIAATQTEGFMISESTILYFRIKQDRAKDITEFRQMLSGDNIAILYILATPIETDLSEEELTAYAALRTNYPTTVVTSDSDPEVGIEVEYVADTQKYIDNKFAELAQNLAATQNTLLEV